MKTRGANLFPLSDDEFSAALKKLNSAAKTTNNCDVQRARIELLRAFFTLKSATEASKRPLKRCKKHGVGCSRKAIYQLARAFIESDFKIEALKGKSRKPHSHPNTTPEEVADLIRFYRFELGMSLREIKMELSKLHYKISPMGLRNVIQRLGRPRRGP